LKTNNIQREKTYLSKKDIEKYGKGILEIFIRKWNNTK